VRGVRPRWEGRLAGQPAGMAALNRAGTRALPATFRFRRGDLPKFPLAKSALQSPAPGPLLPITWQVDLRFISDP
jgi:hypothetical protein